jgi:hypothetical protein
MPKAHRRDSAFQEYRTYHVSGRDKKPLQDFIVEALHTSGCRILFLSPPDEAPFRVTFETADGERLGIVAYAFLANQRVTTNRPVDEHRFQVKYGSKDGRLHELWQDSYGLYTTLFVGIDVEQRIFVGADPVLHSPTKMFISIEFKRDEVEKILRLGWHSWERDRRSVNDPVEVLVGGRPESFLRYIRFERDAKGEDQGHRQLLAEKALVLPESGIVSSHATLPQPSPRRLHQLAEEFQLEEAEVFDLIEKTPRLKMAVRGWVAEEHLLRQLRRVPNVTECTRSIEEGGPDLRLRFRNVPLSVECKNVLRRMTRDNLARIDFQRTRASKGDPCSRYYSSNDFHVLAACLHAVTEHWEFRYLDTHRLEGHAKCPKKLSNNVKVDGRWSAAPEAVLAEVAARIVV